MFTIVFLHDVCVCDFQPDSVRGLGLMVVVVMVVVRVNPTPTYICSI